MATQTIEKEERKEYIFKIFVKGKEITKTSPLTCTKDGMLSTAIGMMYGVRLKYKTAYVGIYTIKDELVKCISF